MARAPVKELQVDEVIRPVANPVDTGFRTPALADGGADNLRSLAQGLAKFDKGVSSLLAERQADQDKADAAQAEVDFHRNNQVGYAKAVEQGLIPAYASKAYMNSWKETEGRNFGNQLTERFNAAYAEWGGKDSEDPAAFDTFLSGFLSQNLPEGTDPQILAGLRPQLRQMVEGGTSRYIADKDKAIKHKAETATVAGAQQGVTASRQKGLEKGQVDYDEMFSGIDAAREKGLKVGMTAEKLDPQIMDMVSTEAVKAGGLEGKRILGYLDRKVPGKDYTFAQTPYGRELKVKTLDAIDTKMRQDVKEGKALQKEKDDKEKQDLTRRAIESLIADPDKPVDDEILKRGSTLDGDFRVSVMRWQETIRSNKASGNRKGLLDLNTAILNGEGMGAVKAALDYGVITSKEELVQAYKLVQDVEKAAPDIADALKGQQIEELFKTIKANTSSKNDLTNPFAPVSPAGLQAQHDLRMAVLQWARENPADAKDPIKREEAISKIGQQILSRITRADTVGEAKYNRQGFEQQPNAYTQPRATDPATGDRKTPFDAAAPGTPPASQPAQPQAPQSQELAPPLSRGAPAQQAAAPASNPKAASAWYDSLPLDTKTAFSSAAAQAKVPFNEYLQRTYEAGIKAGTITVQPSGAAPKAAQPQAAAPTQTTTPAAQPTQVVQPTAADAQGMLPVDAGSVGTSIMEAIRSPADFMSWLAGGGGGANSVKQPGAMDAVRSALGSIQSPADFARWLMGQSNPQADLPAPGAVPAEGTAPGLIQPAAYRPDEVSQPVDETEKVGNEVVLEVQKAIQAALANPKYKSKGNYALSTIKDDALAARLLDFVAGPESNGNYNAVWGKANSNVDLSKFTLDEILKRQQQTVAQGGQSATGRYQFIRKTLLGLKKTLGLSGTEMFTPELQDNLAMQLLRQRGLEEFRAGKLPVEKFANNLAHEWASLPLLSPVTDKKTGRVRQVGESAYSGDGLNKAHVTPGQTVAALLGEDQPQRKKTKS